ncbi:hypothetical protein [Caballeronia sp.]
MKRLAILVTLAVALGSMLGGCIVVPGGGGYYGGGYHQHYDHY